MVDLRKLADLRDDVLETFYGERNKARAGRLLRFIRAADRLIEAERRVIPRRKAA